MVPMIDEEMWGSECEADQVFRENTDLYVSCRGDTSERDVVFLIAVKEHANCHFHCSTVVGSESFSDD